jgi:hypothetical protein
MKELTRSIKCSYCMGDLSPPRGEDFTGEWYLLSESTRQFIHGIYCAERRAIVGPGVIAIEKAKMFAIIYGSRGKLE